MSEETETTNETKRGRKREAPPELVALIDGAIANDLVPLLADFPASDAEIEVVKRYGGTEEFKSRMLGGREKALRIMETLSQIRAYLVATQ